MATQQHNIRTGARGIEWTDRTDNAIGGCLHECRWEMPSGEIAKCYAEELAENGLARGGYPRGFKAHYWRGEKALRELVSGAAPQLIFCDSMSDLFAPWVPEEQFRAILAAMATGGRHHTYQSLTKAVGRIAKHADALPPNLWVGASSAPDFFMGKRLSRAQQERYMHVALENLGAVKATRGNVVWMSIEPLSWDVAPIIAAHPGVLDWAIIGAASNGRRYHQPAAAHVDALLDVLDAQGVDVFYKGNVRPLFETYDFGTAAKNRWREDFPTRPVGDVPGPAPAVARRQRLARRYGWTLNTRLPADAPAPPPAPPQPSQASLF